MRAVDAHAFLQRLLAEGGHDDGFLPVHKIYLIARLILFCKIDCCVASCLQALYSHLHALPLCFSFI